MERMGELQGHKVGAGTEYFSSSTTDTTNALINIIKYAIHRLGKINNFLFTINQMTDYHYHKCRFHHQIRLPRHSILPTTTPAKLSIVVSSRVVKCCRRSPFKRTCDHLFRSVVYSQ